MSDTMLRLASTRVDDASSITINGRSVGQGHPTLVIAEIGVNHDGRLDRALALVESAWEAGADAVKLQLFKASRLVHAKARLASYQRTTGAASPVELLQRYELTEDEIARVIEAIRQTGMLPLATPFSPEDAATIRDFGLPAIKLASPDLVNPLLIDAAAELSLPMLVSTGASRQDEIETAVDHLRSQDATFALLHCVSSYPTLEADAELGRIGELARRFEVPAGYSDHTQNLSAGALAVAARATIIEKHLTHDRTAKGPDHAASADPRQFREYTFRLREAEQMVGTSAASRDVAPAEQDVRIQSRQSLVARNTINAGRPVTREDLTCQRPGTGIPTTKLEDVLGMIALSDIPAGSMLDWTDLNVDSTQAARRAA
ncbi:MAG: N-acetylneuraminate synthase family protein, partial [Planctomycetota bacterium]